MRAGLLSDRGVIKLINEKFVTTWALIDDLKQDTDNPFGETLLSHWEYPLDLMFLTTGGKFVSKLNSFNDLPGAHPDVGHHGDPFARFGPSHADVFYSHAKQFFSRLTDSRLRP